MLAERTSVALPEVSQHFTEGGCAQPAGKRVPSILAGAAALPCNQARSTHWQMACGECVRETTQVLAFEGSPQHAQQVSDMDNTPIISPSGVINVGFA